MFNQYQQRELFSYLNTNTRKNISILSLIFITKLMINRDYRFKDKCIQVNIEPVEMKVEQTETFDKGVQTDNYECKLEEDYVHSINYNDLEIDKNYLLETDKLSNEELINDIKQNLNIWYKRYDNGGLYLDQPEDFILERFNIKVDYDWSNRVYDNEINDDYFLESSQDSLNNIAKCLRALKLYKKYIRPSFN